MVVRGLLIIARPPPAYDDVPPAALLKTTAGHFPAAAFSSQGSALARKRVASSQHFEQR